MTAPQRGWFAARDDRGFKDDGARDGSLLNCQRNKIKNDGERRKMTNVDNPRPFSVSMSLKKRITAFGCLMIILQLMLFDYVVDADKNRQESPPVLTR